ncbi:hypothetical protein ACT3CD_13495 [Geofilum sp. OHC36d9]|uniref:hypothetical protein n=1 Tax=Geofilum sp. OHC36d9 TaxID=3458413 RepID=UPI0040337B26
MKNACPNTPKCPIFNGILSGKEMTANSYKRQYCEAGYARYTMCKRFLSNKEFGVCPPDLLPNSPLSVEEIGMRYNLVVSGNK